VIGGARHAHHVVVVAVAGSSGTKRPQGEGESLACATVVPVARSNYGYARSLRDLGPSTFDIHTVGGRRFASRRWFGRGGGKRSASQGTVPSSRCGAGDKSVPSPCPNVRPLTARHGVVQRPVPRTIVLSATVDSPHQVGSQADSAGSIPVTRSTREKRCSTYESGANLTPRK
jgi:hypothetical protein